MQKTLRQIGIFLISIEVWLIGIAIAISILVNSFLPWAVILAACFWFIRWIIHGKPSKRTPADAGICMLVLMIPVTFWATSFPEITKIQVFRLLTGVFLFYSIVNWTEDQTQLKWVLWSVIGVGIALSIGAFLGVDWSVDKFPIIPSRIYEQFSSVVKDTANPNVLAGSLVIVFPFAPSAMMIDWRGLSWGERVGMILTSIMGMSVLVLTQSRSAVMAVGVIIILILVFRWKWGWLAVSVILIFSMVFIAFLDERTQNGISMTALGTLNINQRIEIWSRAIFMIRDFPFTGIGMGSFKEVVSLFYPFLIYEEAGIAHAHNLFLQIAVDLGIPGLVAWLSILVVVIGVSWQIYRGGIKTDEKMFQGIGMGLLCSLAALVTHGMTDAVTWGMVRPAPIVWALFGFAVATRSVQMSSAKKVSVPSENPA
jgi:putative inorganic carbon (HCO3(-)) transporter